MASKLIRRSCALSIIIVALLTLHAFATHSEARPLGEKTKVPDEEMTSDDLQKRYSRPERGLEEGIEGDDSGGDWNGGDRGGEWNGDDHGGDWNGGGHGGEGGHGGWTPWDRGGWNEGGGWDEGGNWDQGGGWNNRPPWAAAGGTDDVGGRG